MRSRVATTKEVGHVAVRLIKASSGPGPDSTMPMSRTVRIVAGRLVQQVPLRVFERLFPRNPIGFCYHVVTERPGAHVRHLLASKTPREFERELEFIARNYVPLSYADLQPRPPVVRGGRPGAIVTFDDGLRECYSVVGPLLRKHGIPAVFFVTTDFLDNKQIFYRHKVSLCIDAYLRASVPHQDAAREELAEVMSSPINSASEVVETLRRMSVDAANVLDAMCTHLGVDADAYLRNENPYMSSADVRSLAADGFTVGAHGRSHLPLGLMAPSDAEADIVESCAQMAALVDHASVPYAFPFNGRGVSRPLLRRIRESHPQVGLFFDTQGLAQDSADVINRIVLDQQSRYDRVMTDLPIAIRLAYAKDFVRGGGRTLAFRGPPKQMDKADC